MNDATQLGADDAAAAIAEFTTSVDRSLTASPASKEWVTAAMRRHGAVRCPVNLNWLSPEVVLRYGPALAELFSAYPDDLVFGEAYPWNYGYQPPSAPEPADALRVFTQPGTVLGLSSTGSQWTDEWGTRWQHTPGGVGATHVGNPIADWSQLDEYLSRHLPNAALPGRLDRAMPTLNTHGATRYVVAVGGAALFERAQSLRGFENLLEDLYTAPAEMQRLLDALENYMLELIRTWGRLPNVDALFVTDDWGTQSALIISPAMWRQFFAPRYRRLCDEAHRHGLAVAFHSCGHVLPIIGDLIDAGVDIINGLQPEAMDLTVVAREYGGKVAFWGGLSDQAIAHATPNQVRDEVHRAIDLLGAPFGNAYILSMSNILMPEVPLANIEALFETCHAQ